jgi:uncharacterized membrane protein YvbJ
LCFLPGASQPVSVEIFEIFPAQPAGECKAGAKRNEDQAVIVITAIVIIVIVIVIVTFWLGQRYE